MPIAAFLSSSHGSVIDSSDPLPITRTRRASLAATSAVAAAYSAHTCTSWTMIAVAAPMSCTQIHSRHEW